MTHLLRSDDIDVEVCWRADRSTYQCRVTQNDDGEVVEQFESEQAQPVIDRAQHFVGPRISSVFLYRLLEDATCIRVPKPQTRHSDAIPSAKSKKKCKACGQKIVG